VFIPIVGIVDPHPFGLLVVAGNIWETLVDVISTSGSSSSHIIMSKVQEFSRSMIPHCYGSIS
jgi:glutamate racemase